MGERKAIEISEFDDAVDRLKLERRYDREPLDWADKRFGRPDPFAELEREERREREIMDRVMIVLTICVVITLLL